MKACSFAPAMLLVLLTAGCSTRNIEPPTAVVNGMTVQNVDETGFTLAFDLSVSNPNDFELPFSNADYQLALAGAKLIDGQFDPDATIPAKATAPLRLPVNVRYGQLLEAGRAIAESGGNIDYDLGANLKFAGGVWPFGGTKVPIRYRGRLELTQILRDPAVLLNSPEARQLAEKLFGGIFGF